MRDSGFQLYINKCDLFMNVNINKMQFKNVKKLKRYTLQGKNIPYAYDTERHTTSLVKRGQS